MSFRWFQLMFLKNKNGYNENFVASEDYDLFSRLSKIGHTRMVKLQIFTLVVGLTLSVGQNFFACGLEIPSIINLPAFLKLRVGSD